MAALLLGLLLHVGLMALLSWLMGFSPPEPKVKKEKRVVVGLQLPRSSTKTHTVPPKKEVEKAPETDYVSTVNSNPVNETVNRTPRKHVPRRTKKPNPRPEKPKKQTTPAKKEPREAPKKPGEVAVRSVKKVPQEAKKGKALKLFPSEKAVEKILGISSNEYVPGVKSGKETVLKTKKWVGASFFLRVKEAVSQVWDPGTVYKLHDRDGSIYGFKSWFTVLKITLDTKGRIKRIFISKNSGLPFLDQEALRAFKVAAPFPNPPREIVDPKTGLLTFSFGFLVEVNRKMEFKLFRF
ncbi:TonB family protein [Myxococcota bacterium]|nr:TonB family protein [Myxococcota bacterium]